MRIKTLFGGCTLAGVLMGALPGIGQACVMPLPKPTPGNEYEIEVEFEGYDSSSDRVKYKIEIEIEVFDSGATAMQCQCAIGLGSNAITAPTSFNVVRAGVGVVRPGFDFELPEFDGFDEDTNVETAAESLSGFNPGATAYGLSVDVASLDLSSVQAGDLLKLIFEIEFAPDDFDQVNGNSVQFAAGSSDSSHPLGLLEGYEPILQLPSFGVIPEPSTLAIGFFGMMILSTKRRRS